MVQNILELATISRNIYKTLLLFLLVDGEEGGRCLGSFLCKRKYLQCDHSATCRRTKRTDIILLVLNVWTRSFRQ